MRALAFFLGGHDLEMIEIGRLVQAQLDGAALHDKGLPWHDARASAYRAEIAAALAAGGQPVLVELAADLEPEILSRCIQIDHHGERAGADKPTSLEQVFALLGLPAERWNRRLALLAANDRGWIPELRAIGATAEEIAAIRQQDRAAQGISTDEEQAGEAALDRRQTALGGSLTMVYLPHNRTAVVMDRLALEPASDPPPDTLIISPTEINFSGSGNRVRVLDAAFPGGWLGGALPAYGFWGRAAPVPCLDEIIAALMLPR